MSSATRYDAAVVGGGLAGVAVATLLAKRNRRVMLIEPRAEWGGRYPLRSVGQVTIPTGPMLADDHERLGHADAYFEAIGLSLPLLIREGAVMRREPVQTIWGGRRVTLGADRTDVIEELRRECRESEPAVQTVLADLDAATRILAPLFQDNGRDRGESRWGALRRRAAARAFASRFCRSGFARYAADRQWPAAIGDYLAAWSRFQPPDDSLAAQIFRIGLAMKGLIALPEGTAGLCRFLAARFAALGGHVVRGPITRVTSGRRPSLDVAGNRVESEILIINSSVPPGTNSAAVPGNGLATGTAVFAVPADCIPEPMGRYLLFTDDGADEMVGWTLARRPWPGVIGDRHSESGGREVIVSSQRWIDHGPKPRGAQPIAFRLAALMPLSRGSLASLGVVSDHEVPFPIEPGLWGATRWRVRRFGWYQEGRSPVWWLPDVGSPWVRNAAEYRSALAVDHIVTAA